MIGIKDLSFYSKCRDYDVRRVYSVLKFCFWSEQTTSAMQTMNNLHLYILKLYKTGMIK